MLAYYNIANLLKLFECESYLLRIAIIKILTNIVVHILAKEDQDSERYSLFQKTQDKFIQILMKRFYDKSSFCRSKILKSFIKFMHQDE